MSSEYVLRPRGLARAFRSFVLVSVSLAVQTALLEGQQPDGLSATLDFGIVNAAGNTEVTTVNVGEELLFGAGPWGGKQTFGVVYGRTDGEVSASLWRGAVRGDRSVGGRLGVYLLVAFDRNTFAGLSRRFEEGVGLVLSVHRTAWSSREVRGSPSSAPPTGRPTPSYRPGRLRHFAGTWGMRATCSSTSKFSPTWRTRRT